MKSVFLLLCLSLFLSPGGILADGSIKIGILTDLSGNASYYGNQSRIGAMLAEKELSEEGKKVRIIFEDSALSTSRGLSAAQKLISMDEVDALYVNFSTIAVAVSALVEQTKKVMVYSAAAESVARKNPFAFKTYSDYSVGCEALVREFLKKGKKKIGVLKGEAEYGELCLAGAKKAAEVVDQSYRQGEPVAAQMLAFKNKGIEAIINANYEGDIANMLQAAHNIKYAVHVGIVEDSMTKDMIARFSESLNGALTFGLQSVPEDLVVKFRAIPGGDKLAGYEGARTGYLHVKQLAAAVESCPGQSGECVANALSLSKSEPEMGFEGWKDRIARMRTVIKEYSKGELRQIGSYVAD